MSNGVAVWPSFVTCVLSLSFSFLLELDRVISCELLSYFDTVPDSSLLLEVELDPIAEPVPEELVSLPVPMLEESVELPLPVEEPAELSVALLPLELEPVPPI